MSSLPFLTPSSLALPEPALYFAPESGKYTVTPSLLRLGTDFGNGARDSLVFQLDREFPRYRTSGLVARTTHPERHVLRREFNAATQAAVVRAIVERVAWEHPELFQWHTVGNADSSLSCALTSECLRFDSNGDLRPSGEIPYRDALDALCAQVQEDLAVVQRMPDGADQIVALNVCAPSRWVPEEKIGRNFDVTHAPVPGMEKIRTAARGLTAAMVERPPTVRFTWGIEFDDQLNLHPLAEAQDPRAHRILTAKSLEGRPLYLRVERQVIVGLPAVDAALFVIRPYIYDLRELIRDEPERRDALIAALHSMPEASRQYKGLPPPVFESVLQWLDFAATLPPSGNRDTQ